MGKQLLPHQHHRRLGTVKKTKEHVARVKAAQKREKGKLKGGNAEDGKRSNKWPTARKHYLKSPEVQANGCAACGAKTGLQVHHVVPFHTNPALELDPTNYIALCEYVGGLECHEFIGHGGHNGGFKKTNLKVREDAAELRAHPDRLAAIHARIEKNAVPNKPSD
jgi:5-methylcytosine-specific restriction protein A